jgi:MraZ protein
MFRGVAQLALDVKFRLAIPAKYREAISARCGGRLVITADPSTCLLLYPQCDWEPIQEKLMALSSFNSRMRSLQRLLVGYAEDVEMDSAGRILLSPPLREFSGVEKRVMLVGQGNKFEVWDEAKWSTQRDHALEFRDTEIPGELEGFSL